MFNNLSGLRPPRTGVLQRNDGRSLQAPGPDDAQGERAPDSSIRVHSAAGVGHVGDAQTAPDDRENKAAKFGEGRKTRQMGGQSLRLGYSTNRTLL